MSQIADDRKGSKGRFIALRSRIFFNWGLNPPCTQNILSPTTAAIGK